MDNLLVLQDIVGIHYGTFTVAIPPNIRTLNIQGLHRRIALPWFVFRIKYKIAEEEKCFVGLLWIGISQEKPTIDGLMHTPRFGNSDRNGGICLGNGAAL